MERDVTNHNVNVKFSGVRDYESCYDFSQNNGQSDDTRERQMGRFDCNAVVSAEYQLPEDNLQACSGHQNGVYWIKLPKLSRRGSMKIK